MESYKTMTEGEYHEACEGLCKRFEVVLADICRHPADTPERVLATEMHGDELERLTADVLALADGDLIGAMTLAEVVMAEARHRASGGRPRVSPPDADEAARPLDTHEPARRLSPAVAAHLGLLGRVEL